MAEFSLDKFKYRWRGDWTTATSYRRDDIVRLNGKSYVCLVAHTSSSAFTMADFFSGSIVNCCAL